MYKKIVMNTKSFEQGSEYNFCLVVFVCFGFLQ